jgi:hypothetical protein
MTEDPQLPEPPDVLPNKKGYSWRPSLSDAQLWALGFIVAQWQLIEVHMGTQVLALTQGDADAQTEFRSKTTFEARRDIWKDVVTRLEFEPRRAALLGIIGDIGSVKADRDKMVHGLLIGGDSNQDGMPVYHSGMAMEKTKTDRRNFVWRFTFDRMRQVAQKLDRINLRLSRLMIGG